MQIALIAAMAKNRAIGKDNQLLWHLPADLAHFKALTLDKPIVMGRKTYESIGRPLPRRQNIIVTRDEAYTAEGCEVVHSLPAALDCGHDATEIMIIGGAGIYAQAIDMAQRMYLTMVDVELPGDCFFPQWDPNEWHVVEREHHQADDKNAYDYTFMTLER
ncbi:MAG: type 3 dihydrofolate reductase [Legionellales bacterium]|nr:type 3 dihydrofolate reductase [Legionellales bacterium]|tara:strand:- start:5021 stop:5503 length:483 start_codon:yes stop_codon:yes gene_type:complete